MNLTNPLETQSLALGLDVDFVTKTKEIRTLLADTQRKCEEFDSRNGNFSESDKIEFVRTLGEKTYPTLNDYFKQIWFVCQRLTTFRYKDHVRYFQENLLPFFVRDDAYLNKRIYDKPLGYAGDYLTVKYLYEDGYPGTSTYGKFIDRYTLETPLARAHINRRKYLNLLIRKLIEKRAKISRGEAVRITSFACGPGTEFLDLFSAAMVPPNLKIIFTCVDGEPRALEDLNKEIKARTPHGNWLLSFKPVCQNILNLVRTGKMNGLLNEQDLVYCAGFFDYLSDRTVARCIPYMCSLLRQDGLFVGVNVFADSPLLVYLEMLGGWYLNHRDRQKLLFLSQGVDTNKHKHVLSDPETRMNFYLVIRK